ncbi:rhodanese-like domain-containing protein [Lyngbya aestuarii]|uniref:rhodanese-like domain-containing protein n=1 Tax=Lyngbya aestuarii TaxID=118322 RepID=UPI00403DAE8A
MIESPFVVSPEYLRENLNHPQVVIVDCRFALADPELGYRQYQTSHIPGAHYLDLNKDLSSSPEQHGGRHPLPDLHKLAHRLAAIGVNFQETLVIAYDDSRLAFAARLWWLLRYLGHDKVALLDGGWKTWQSAEYPVTDALPAAQPGTFTPQLRQDWVVDIEAVKTRKDLPDVALVDSRDSDRYWGKQEPIDPVAGHIPGALNHPWQEVTDNQGHLQPLAKQQQRWVDVKDKQEVLVYCGSGVTACVNLFSLKLAGIDTGKLYAGSWSDWCSYLQ